MSALSFNHLQVSVDDFQRVQVGYGLQHLPHDIAGVPLRVVPLVQDPVEDLSACSSGQREHLNEERVACR